MEVLPDTASLASFFVVTAVLCAVTFGVTFNLQLIIDFVRRRVFAKLQKSMAEDPSPQWQGRAAALRQKGLRKSMTPHASRWSYWGYVFDILSRMLPRFKPSKRSEATPEGEASNDRV